MGGSAPTAEFTQMDPGIREAILGNLSRAQAATEQGVSRLQGDFSRFAPQLQTEFRASAEIDPRTRAILGLADEQRRAALATQQGQIMRQLGGRSPGLAQVLSQQAAGRATLAANPLLFQATEQQTQRQQQEGLLSNAARLQQAQQAAAMQQASNQAAFAPVAAQQNLLSILSQAGAATGARVAAETKDVDFSQGRIRQR